MLDLSAKNFINEVDRFCQLFISIEKVKLLNKNEEPNFDKQCQQINQMIVNNKNINSELRYKSSATRRFLVDSEMF